MKLRGFQEITALVFLCCYGTARLHAQTAPSLAARFQRLSCAVVQISTSKGFGTGFFIDERGTVLTASHVIQKPIFSVLGTGATVKSLDVFTDILVTTVNGQTATAHARSNDLQNPSFDLAYLDTGLTSACHLTVGAASLVNTGDTLTAIGFPQQATKPVLYSGFLSAVYPHPKVPMGVTDTGQLIYGLYDVMRVQMPISPGASGAPLIGDDDKVIGVISEVPVVWTNNLQDAMEMAGFKGQASGVSYGSNGRNLDFVSAIGDLAYVVHEFESPGSGYAVPLSNLRRTQPAEKRLGPFPSQR